MNGRIYLWQDEAPLHTFLAHKMAREAQRRLPGPHEVALIGEGVGGDGEYHAKVYWDADALIPWFQPSSDDPDDVLEFMRMMSNFPDISRVRVWIEEVLPLDAISSEVKDAVYGGMVVQARVTRFFMPGDMPAVRIEVVGTDPTQAADLFIAVRNGAVEPIGGWTGRNWRPDVFHQMHWELPEVASVR